MEWKISSKKNFRENKKLTKTSFPKYFSDFTPSVKTQLQISKVLANSIFNVESQYFFLNKFMIFWENWKTLPKPKSNLIDEVATVFNIIA